MKVNEAIEQISEIHDHLNRTEFYRGFRSVPVALSGLAGCLAAFLQPTFLGRSPAPLTFVYYWTLVASGNLSMIILFTLYCYLFQENRLERKRTRHVWAQFSPSLVIGLLLTLSIVPLGNDVIALLPGLWAFVMSLGIFATGPFLPRMSRWMAMYYLLAGFLLLGLAQKGLAFSAWGMGLTFGLGQFIGAAILYLNLERKNDDGA